MIYTVAYNSANNKTDATIFFLIDGTELAQKSVALAPGGAEIVSVEWKGAKGTHAIQARFESGTISQTTGVLTITVPEPLPPTGIEKSVQFISNIASSSAPFIVSGAQTIFAHTETLRQGAVERLERYIENGKSLNKQKSATSSPVVSGFDAPSDLDVAEESNTSWWNSITQSAAAAALFTMKSVALFYPLIGIIFLLLLYALMRRLARPRP